MFYKKSFFVLSFILYLVLFPSCIKYYKLEKDEFPQGKDHAQQRKVIKDNLRKVAVYDQFSTMAIFDVLWLSDETRKSYVDIYCRKQGRNDQEKDAILRRQLEENKHWHSFYVLADVRAKTNKSLSDKDAAWSMYLSNKENKKIRPISVKEVELDPEHQSFFGHRFNLYKRFYLVKFPTKSLDGTDLFDLNKGFKLVFDSPEKGCDVCWGEICKKTADTKKTADSKNIKNKKKTGKKKKEKIYNNEDYYWV